MTSHEVGGNHTSTSLPNQPSTPEEHFSRIPGCNWTITNISNPSGSDLWFQDGQTLSEIRGGNGVSSRLIVGGQGFLDLTSFIFPTVLGVDLNGATIFTSEWVTKGWPSTEPSHLTFRIDLKVDNGRFTANAQLLPDPRLNLSNFPESLHTNQRDWKPDPVVAKSSSTTATVNGVLKPLPPISDDDVRYMDSLIAQKYIPYRDGNGGGKSDEEIRNLGKRLFPFTNHNYNLALSIYDWTTPSFVRMVLFKVFQYTSISGSPLCKGDIANMIWESDWDGAGPSDKSYMMTFMMHPASSLDEVKYQLDNVSDELRKFSDMENRILESAIAAMPRTSYISKPRLYSGQVDIYQFGVDRFGPEFLECPINGGPIADTMTWDFQNTLDTFVSAGKIITTKMVCSFTDSYQKALHFSNGIILVANGTPRIPSTSSPFNLHSFVWETPSFVTELSDDSTKIEYTFPAGSQFKVISWYKNKTNRVVINLQVYDPSTAETTSMDHDTNIAPELPWSWQMPLADSEAQETLYDDSMERKARERANEMKGQVEPDALIPAALTHSYHGRWCRCVQAVLEVLA